MLQSKVRIEFTEDCGDGKFNLEAQESGSVGSVDVASDLCYALDVCPRPLEVIARAVVQMGSRHEGLEGLAGKLMKAAQAYVDGWVEVDAASSSATAATSLDGDHFLRMREAFEKLHGHCRD